MIGKGMQRLAENELSRKFWYFFTLACAGRYWHWPTLVTFLWRYVFTVKCGHCGSTWASFKKLRKKVGLENDVLQRKNPA
jgi:hypothetical protein